MPNATNERTIQIIADLYILGRNKDVPAQSINNIISELRRINPPIDRELLTFAIIQWEKTAQYKQYLTAQGIKFDAGDHPLNIENTAWDAIHKRFNLYYVVNSPYKATENAAVKIKELTAELLELAPQWDAEDLGLLAEPLAWPTEEMVAPKHVAANEPVRANINEEIDALFKETREQQKTHLGQFNATELRIVAKALVATAQKDTTKKYNLGLLGNEVAASKLGKAQLIQGINQVLKQFPEIADDRLAIDRSFVDPKAKFDAIIADINADRMPQNRYYELLYQNLFEAENGLKSSRTFLAYALPKLKHPEAFLNVLETLLGKEQLGKYLSTPILLAGHEGKLNIFDLYLKDFGHLNRSERAELSKDTVSLLKKHMPPEPAKPIVAINNVDTHNTSSHKSADDSHLAAFELFKSSVQAAGQDVNNVVVSQLQELQGKVNEMSAMSDAALFDNYVRYGEIEKYKNITYDALSAAEKQSFQKKIDGFRFQANTAKRYIDDMQNHHKANTTGIFQYDTAVATSNGLTMEQVLATAYWASKDTEHFRDAAVNARDNLVSLVKQVYDMRRGYNIEHIEDKPEELKFSANVADKSRCSGGGVNSLSWALASAHTAYNPKLILARDIERALNEIYEKIVAANISELKKMPAAVLQEWIATGRTTGVLKEFLDKEFNSKYEAEFTAFYKGYVADNQFASILSNGANNLKVPTEIKEAAIENMTSEGIAAAIISGNLPLLTLDVESGGYVSTLNYLRTRAKQEHLIEDLLLIVTLGEENWRESQKGGILLSFLSRSDLPEEYKRRVIWEGYGLNVTLGDVLSAAIEDFLILLKGNLLFYAASANNLAMVKHILTSPEAATIRDEWLKQEDKDGDTALAVAARRDHSEIVRTILQSLEPTQRLELLKQKDQYDLTALVLAASEGHHKTVNAILESLEPAQRLELLKQKDNEGGDTALISAVYRGQHETVRAILDSVEPAQRLELLQQKNSRDLGYTALMVAADNGYNKTVNAILESVEPAQRLALLQQENMHGWTALMFAAKDGHHETVKAILESVNSDQKIELLKQEKYDGTALMLAAKNGHHETVKAILESIEPAQRLALLQQKDKDGNTALMLAAKKGHHETVRAILESLEPFELSQVLKQQAKACYEKSPNKEGISAILSPFIKTTNDTTLPLIEKQLKANFDPKVANISLKIAVFLACYDGGNLPTNILQNLAQSAKNKDKDLSSILEHIATNGRTKLTPAAEDLYILISEAQNKLIINPAKDPSVLAHAHLANIQKDIQNMPRAKNSFFDIFGG